MPDLLWQQHAVNKLSKSSEGGMIVYASVGEGKSRVALRLVARLQPKTVLIVCRRKSFYDWSNEIIKVGYGDWTVDDCDNFYPYRRSSFPLVYLVSADSIPKHLNDIERFLNVDCIIFDELYLFSNVKAIRTRNAIELSEMAKMVVGLSGTIMPAKDNTAIWGQTRSIGISNLLARTLTEYRNRFQTSFIMPNLGFRQQKNKPGSEKQILKLLEDRIYLHFPPADKRKITEKFNIVPLTGEQTKIIKQLKEEYYVKMEEDGGELDIKTATSLVAKIQQISNGYIRDNRGDTYYLKSNKLDALQQSVTEALAADEQVLIWCAFRHDIVYLEERLGVATLQLVGGKPFNIESWQRGDVNVVLATEGSGASVNHFVGVRYAKYFSLNYRWLDLQQSRGRTGGKRAHSKGCHYEYFFTEGTLDKSVYDTASKSGEIETGFIKTWLKKNT